MKIVDSYRGGFAMLFVYDWVWLGMAGVLGLASGLDWKRVSPEFCIIFHNLSRNDFARTFLLNFIEFHVTCHDPRFQIIQFESHSGLGASGLHASGGHRHIRLFHHLPLGTADPTQGGHPGVLIK